MNNFEEFDKYVMTTYKRFPVSFEYGNGIYLYDENNKKYLDFTAGIAVNALGYGNKNYINAIFNQINKINHSSNLYYIKPQGELAKLLSEVSGLDKAFFCNSGAEANEAALKLARKYAFINNKGNKIIAMKNSFHGRTIGSLTLTGQEKYQKAFKPLMGNVEYGEFNNLESIEKLMSDEVCAIIAECIQGEGGIIPMEKEFYLGLRKLCDKYNALLIIDEVQTGIARCGEFFAFQNYAKNYDEAPDIICLAKGLGNGVPIGAIVAKEKTANAFEPSDHASTFGGNFISTTAGIATIKEILNLNLVQNAKNVGEYLYQKLNELKPLIKDVRGMGLMIGVEIEGNISEVIQKCLEDGLLIIGAGKNTIRFVPPLIITKEDVNLAIEIFKKAITYKKAAV